jgi:hypothetical protein
MMFGQHIMISAARQLTPLAKLGQLSESESSSSHDEALKL